MALLGQITYLHRDIIIILHETVTDIQVVGDNRILGGMCLRKQAYQFIKEHQQTFLIQILLLNLLIEPYHLIVQGMTVRILVNRVAAAYPHLFCKIVCAVSFEANPVGAPGIIIGSLVEDGCIREYHKAFIFMDIVYLIVDMINSLAGMNVVEDIIIRLVVAIGVSGRVMGISDIIDHNIQILVHGVGIEEKIMGDHVRFLSNSFIIVLYHIRMNLSTNNIGKRYM